jgi:hypothetical protein
MLQRIAAVCAGVWMLGLGPAVQAQPLETPVVAQARQAPEGEHTTHAEGRKRIGYGWILSNDLIGDGKDRWRSGSVASSRIYGRGWSGVRPDRFGDLLEIRFQGQILAPERLSAVNPADRPWAGALSLGLHSHARIRGFDLSIGGDLVVIGPQTGLDSFQDGLHDLVGAPRPRAAVLARQIADTVRPTAVAEIARSYSLSDSTSLRPFAELRAGDETLARIGADLVFGGAGAGELLVREAVTGQRYRAIARPGSGLSVSIGGDVAHVDSSVYLPAGSATPARDIRGRLRAGVHWQGTATTAFYGLTYLGEEFSGQREGQLTGSLQLQVRF